MSSSQIPNLPAATALTGAEQLEAVQAGTSVRVTIDQITDVVSADVASYAAAAAASASSAATSAASALDSENDAGVSETNAAASAAAALVSENNAAASAASIVVDAAAAAASAAAALVSENNAAASEDAAATSAFDADVSAVAAAASFDSFDDRYLGAKASAPVVDNDGNALLVGALYFNTVTNLMNVWDGTNWLVAYASAEGAMLSINNLSDVASVSTSRTNLGLGTAATTNATAYATAAQGALADGALQRAGGTMTGPLVLAADPTVNLQAATKQYVDTVAAEGIHYHDPVYVESPDTAGNLTATYTGGGTSANIIGIANGSDITFSGYTPVVDDQFLTSTGNGLTSGTQYWIVALVGGAAQISLTFGGSIITGLTNGTPTLPSTINPGVGATLTNAGTQVALTVDTVLMTVGKRVLIYNQTNAYENGVYTVTTVGTGSTNWVLTRSTDTDTYEPSSPDALGQGDAFFVQAGATGAGETYAFTTAGSVFFGITNLSFSQISSAKVYSAGTGLDLTGTVFSINNTVATLTGIQTLTNKTLTSPTISGGTITGITDLAVADGGTGASDAPTARTNLGAQATVTGAATTITGADLTTARALISNISGKVDVSGVTSTELAFLSGTTSAVQTQLNAKAPTASPTLTGQASFADGSAAAPSIAHTGDLNAGIFFPAADTVAFTTNSTERMRVDNQGRLGLGTTSPLFNLQVALADATSNKSIGLTETSYTTNFRAEYLTLYGASATGTTFGLSNANLGTLTFQNLSAGLIGTNGAFPLVFATTSLERMRIDASGNVGIGTSAPATPLDVVSNSSAEAIAVRGRTADNVSSILFKDNGNTATYGSIVAASNRLTLGSLGATFINFNTNSTERMRIDSSGNVGIGTSSPTFTSGSGLEVERTDANATLRLQRAGTSPSSMEIRSGPNTGEIFVTSNSPLLFATNGTERMRIDGSGNVGIGTSSPTAQLQITSFTSETNGIRFSATGWAYFGRLGINGTAGSEQYWSANYSINASTLDDATLGTSYVNISTGGRVTFGTGATNTAPTERMRIDASGNVGIGTSSPATKLDVSGTITATGYAGTVDGTNPVGYRNIPPVGTKTASYTLATGDVGKYVQVSTGGSIVIPDATFAEGDAVVVFNNTAAAITITCTITTAYIAGTNTDKATVSLATRGIANIFFVSGTICAITGNVT